jgi:5-hydroxyisourate hydrolase
MGHLSTHVLDTMHGCPAAGMQVALHRVGADGVAERLASLTLNADGRNDGGPLLDATTLVAGRYRLLFSVGDYYRGRGVTLPEPPFVDVVALDFGIADATAKWHVPLLVSPWSWSTYRGS